MYTFKTNDNYELKKRKGIKKNITDDDLKFEDFTNAFLNGSSMIHEINRMQSAGLIIGTYRINKTSISCCNDKKYILKDGYGSLSYFHKSIH